MTFSTIRRVEFRDTDAAGIVHFSAFFPMMEAAEHELLRSLGIAVLPYGSDAVTWPRVSASCDYRSAARFEDQLQIEVLVEHIGTSSVRYGFRFTRESDLIAEGCLTAVCCRLTPPDGSDHLRGGLEKAEIPAEIRSKLTKHQ